MEDLSSELEEWLEDPEQFIGTLQIKGVGGEITDFAPNPSQLSLLKAISHNRISVVLKARQLGISTMVVAYLFWRWYTSPDPITILSVTDTFTKTSNMMSMFETFYAALPEALRRPLAVDNTQRKVLKDTGATFTVMTAGAHGGVRSGTVQIAHLSEFAFYPDPDEFMSTLSAALHDGKLIIESTANYQGDALEDWVKIATDAESEDVSFQFFPWYTLDSYKASVDSLESLTTYEEALVKDHNCKPEQLQWRRNKLRELRSETKFKREYPATIEEAYENTEGYYFDDLSLVQPLELDEDEITLEAPVVGVRYVLGGDPSGGTGGDPASIVVVNAVTEEPVYIWRDPHTPPKGLAHKIHHIATLYNNALVVVESNNHGGTVLNELEHLGYTNVYTEDGKPWLTTTQSKILLLNRLRERLTDAPMTLDKKTLREIRGWKDLGDRPVFVGNTGHGDTTIALALAIWGLKSLNTRTAPPLHIQRAQQRLRLDKIQRSFNINRRYT